MACTLPFCGTGSPLPDRTRAGPCLAVIAGQHVFVFDAGDGASETLSLMGINQSEIEALFLTHIHSDHIDGLDTVALCSIGPTARRRSHFWSSACRGRRAWLLA